MICIAGVASVVLLICLKLWGWINFQKISKSLSHFSEGTCCSDHRKRKSLSTVAIVIDGLLKI